MPNTKNWRKTRHLNFSGPNPSVSARKDTSKRKIRDKSDENKENERPSKRRRTYQRAALSPLEAQGNTSCSDNATQFTQSGVFDCDTYAATPHQSFHSGIFKLSEFGEADTPINNTRLAPIPPQSPERADNSQDRDQTRSPSPTVDTDTITEADMNPSAQSTSPGTIDDTSTGRVHKAPTVETATSALRDLQGIFRATYPNAHGYKHTNFDPFVRPRMEGMRTLFNFYTSRDSIETYGKWQASSFRAAISLGRGRHCARMLRKLCQQFIANRSLLPINPYGNWNESLLVDEDITNDLNLYLQEVGKEITARKVMDYLARTEVMKKHGITHAISERTARRYLLTLGYRWQAAKKGQFVDGHEREDVVWYRVKVFLPAWKEIHERMAKWSSDGTPEMEYGPYHIAGKRVIVWFHDETIFYAHDRRGKAWHHKDAPAKPYQKGEGLSLMIADFVSADFGWLASKDGSRTARRIFKPGKNRDGWFANEDILAQYLEALSNVTEAYPEFEHFFVYDNATTHLKRSDNAISARHMPRNIPKGDKNWLIEVNDTDSSGNPIYTTTSKNGVPTQTRKKIKIKMGNGINSHTGEPQSFYFEDGENAGKFKGMVEILKERGFDYADKLLAQCKDWKCKPTPLGVRSFCCCRRILFEEPDFVMVPSILETAAESHGSRVIFLPKFHCELNFIEQCWGYAKRVYRLNPESSREDHLERNSINALDSVPLESMRRFANRSLRFMDAYAKGLDGPAAAWAARKYRGHRVLPASVMAEFDAVHP